MIDLRQPTEPYGIEVTVTPLTTATMATAQAAAWRAVEAIERQVKDRNAAGLPTTELPDLQDEAERNGFCQSQLIRELAVRHITSWAVSRSIVALHRRRPRTSPQP
jgi:hypothetical protein